ncbi:MAG: SDR family NAD(P)-dependent oxidoreductase [Myxococcota bacterium]
MGSEPSDRPAVLVTGGNSGIGFECARCLAREGERVLVASRNQAASAEAVRRIVRETGNEAVGELELDLGSQASVRQLAKEIDARRIALRGLVCNAGLQLSAGPKPSSEGFEQTFAVNHLGHFLLTNLLLSNLAAHTPARVVMDAARAGELWECSVRWSGLSSDESPLVRA